MKRESYLLSNGRSIVFTDRKLWLTRNGELSDVLKSLLAVGFAVVSFVTTMATAAGLAQQVSLPGVLLSHRRQCRVVHHVAVFPAGDGCHCRVA